MGKHDNDKGADSKESKGGGKHEKPIIPAQPKPSK